MTLPETFEAIRSRYQAAQGLRRLADLYDAELAEMVRSLGMSAEVIARETGIPVEDIHEQLGRGPRRIEEAA